MTEEFALLDERMMALMLIAGAFQLAQRPLGYEDEAVLGVRIRDAYREGIRGTGDLAFCALERSGHAPRWIDRGGVRTIGLSGARV